MGLGFGGTYQQGSPCLLARKTEEVGRRAQDFVPLWKEPTHRKLPAGSSYHVSICETHLLYFISRL